MGSFGQSLKDAIERDAIVTEWNKRLESVNRAELCREYGLDEAQLSRWLSRKNGPGWDSIKRVEKALNKAGV